MRCNNSHVDGLVQERRNSIANALELHLSCSNPLMWCHCIGTLFIHRPIKAPVTWSSMVRVMAWHQPWWALMSHLYFSLIPMRPFNLLVMWHKEVQLDLIKFTWLTVTLSDQRAWLTSPCQPYWHPANEHKLLGDTNMNLNWSWIVLWPHPITIFHCPLLTLHS